MIDPTLEPQIIIDADLRHIEVPEVLYNIAVHEDHKSEMVYFTIPRFFDDKDLSTHTTIVRCINAGKQYYEMAAKNITTTLDKITFGWEINSFVTRFPGIIQFTIMFQTIGTDGLLYQWQTTKAEMNILPALDLGEINYDDETDDLIKRLCVEVETLRGEVEELAAKAEGFDELKNNYIELEKRVKYLEDNVIYATVEV